VDGGGDVGRVGDEVGRLADAEGDIVQSHQLYDVCRFGGANLDAGMCSRRGAHARVAVQNEGSMQENAQDVPYCSMNIVSKP
jgi:hypothetical protein